MPSAPVAGFSGFLKIATTPTPTTAVVQYKDGDIPFNSDMYDVSIMGARYKAYIPGLIDAMLNFKANWDQTNDAVQGVLWSAYLAGTLLYFSFSPNGTNHYDGTAYVKTLKVHDPVNGPAESDFSLQVTGSYSYT